MNKQNVAVVFKLFSKNQNCPPHALQMESIHKSDLVQLERKCPKVLDALALTSMRHPDLGAEVQGF